LLLKLAKSMQNYKSSKIFFRVSFNKLGKNLVFL
jgi:hypothetical protein